ARPPPRHTLPSRPSLYALTAPAGEPRTVTSAPGAHRVTVGNDTEPAAVRCHRSGCRADHTVSSRSSGVRNRGVTRTSPIQPATSPAAASTAAVASLPMSSSNRYTTSPLARCAQPPTTRPLHHTVGPTLPDLSNRAGVWSPRYHDRCDQPIGVGSSAG